MELRFAGAVLFLLHFCIISAQGSEPVQPTYDYLLSQIEIYEGTPKVWPYLKSYLSKAKQEKNWPEAVMAYKEMLHESDGEIRFVYADSMVAAAKKSLDDDIIGSAYLTKGVAFYKSREHHKALDNYLIANKYLLKSDDEYLRHKVKYSIAQIKYYLGYYHEAISLFQDCVTYFRDGEKVPYLKSLHHLCLCYTFTENYKWAESTANLALKESARLGEKSLLPYIDVAIGINNFYKGQYQQAVDNINYSLPDIRRDKDFASESTANFYLGRALWELGQQRKAVNHFLVVDKIFEAKQYIRPDLRISYEYLIKYYHKQDIKGNELLYINKLLKADSILGKEFRHLIKRVHKEYDTAELLAEKEKIESDLQQSRWSGWLLMAIAASMGIVTIYLIRRHRKMQKIYRRRYKELLDQSIDKVSKNVPQPGQIEEININPEIIKSILDKLEEFERRKGYLKKDLDATSLAKSFDTNYKYLSKVIRCHRQKSFVNYINDLRVNYLVSRLRLESLLRNYTNGALAAEAGFSTTQHFTVAFKKSTGMPVVYFVDQLKKEQI